MPFPQFDRGRLVVKPLTARRNKLAWERVAVSPETRPGPLDAGGERALAETVARVRAARAADKPVILAFGAHAIKNGLGPVLIRLIERGWVTHLATNGAGIIHDWEFAFQGASGEDVRANVDRGEFGIWEETGRWLNLAIAVGAWRGFGYGESVGALIQEEGLEIPAAEALASCITPGGDLERAAAAADLLELLNRCGVKPGLLKVPHPRRAASAQAAAYRLNVPFTAHPMIGHDIIYNHPLNHGGAIGRAALRDFLSFADSVSRVDGGVYLSVGSAVMSPMIFEKAFAMAQNLARQQGRHIDRHFIAVVDLAEAAWDWQRDGEPPQEHPAYYLRYCKTFSRMGGEMRYLRADNRDFLLALWQGLG
jgi:hypothetical protein